MRLNSWNLLLLSSLLVVGCGVNTDSEDAQNAVDTTEVTSNESALMEMASTDATVTSCSFTSDQVAEAALGRFKAGTRDASCVQATRTGNEVDYVMTSCSGRWGRLTVTGTMHVVYTANADCSVDAVGSGQGLQVNRATIDLDATAHWSKDSSGVETVVVNTHSKGGGTNVQLDHVGSYTVTRDQATGCRTLDGQWSTDWSAQRGSATTSTTATGLKKCGDACPAAGGQVVHQGVLGRVVTLTFDGSAVASWETNRGKSGTINLPCGQ